MRGYVGIGQSEDIEQAIQEATSGLLNADLLILVAPYAKAEAAATLLSEKYPSVPMIGASGASLGKDKTSDSQIMVVGFAGVTVACGIIENTKKAPISSIKDFENNLKAIEPNSNNTICIEFITESEEKTMSTMGTLLRQNNIDLVGASTYGTPLGEKNMVIFNGKKYNASCVYAFVKNNAGKIRTFKENIYEKISNKAHFANLVDSNTKALFQLDGSPAHEVYTQETGVEKDDIVSNMITYPLGRGLGDDICITTTTSLDMNGVMFNGKAIYENDSIYIMKLGDYRSINENTKSKIRSSVSKASFMLAFDSVDRLRLFASENYLEDYINHTASICPYGSFIGIGQQHNNQHMNQTMVCAVFE